MRRSRGRPAAWATTSASTTRSGCTRRSPTGHQRQSIGRGRPPGRAPADAQSKTRRPLLTLTYFGLPAVLTMGTTLLFLLKAPAHQLATLNGPTPVRVSHELYSKPTAPVIRTLLRWY